MIEMRPACLQANCFQYFNDHYLVKSKSEGIETANLKFLSMIFKVVMVSLKQE